MSRSLNGLSNIYVNTLNSGDAINIVSSSSTSQSTINVDINKQSPKTTPVNSDLFLLEESNGNIKKITYQNLSDNIDSNFWRENNDILKPLYPSSSVLVGGTNMNVNNFKFQVEGNSYLNGNLLVETDTNTNNRQLLINGAAEITGNIYLNTISSGTWNGSVLGKAYLPADTFYSGDLATATSFATSQSSNYIIGAGGTNHNYTSPNSIRGFEIEIGDVPQDTTAPYSDTTSKGSSRIDIQCRTGSDDNTINLLCVPVWNEGINSTINLTATSRSGSLAQGASNINITANDTSFSQSNGAKITLSAQTEIIMNSLFKINSSGLPTYNSLKILNENSLLGGTNVSIVNNSGVLTINATDTNTTYTAGTNLSLSGTQFNMDTTLVGNLTFTGTTTYQTNLEITGPTNSLGYANFYSNDNNYISLKTNTNIGSTYAVILPSSTGTLALTSDLSSFITASSSDTLTNKTINSASVNILAFTGNSSSTIATPNSSGTLALQADIPTVYWQRNSNIGSFDIETTSNVNNIDITVPFSTSSTLKATGGLVSGSSDYLKYISYSSTYPLECYTILNGTATYHMAFKHNSTESGAFPLIKQDNSANFILHWDGEGDRFTFTKNGKLTLYGDLYAGTYTDISILRVGLNRINSYIEHYYYSSSSVGGMYMEQTGSARLYWNGSTVTTAGTWADISDSRVKLNQQLADTKILATAFDNIDLYSYNYTEQYALENGKSSTNTVYGWIAQNVIEQTKDISTQFGKVCSNQQTFPNGKIDYKGEKQVINDLNTINKKDLTILLWAKVKEQQEQIDNLTALVQNQQLVINNLLSATTFANFKKM